MSTDDCVVYDLSEKVWNFRFSASNNDSSSFVVHFWPELCQASWSWPFRFCRPNSGECYTHAIMHVLNETFLCSSVIESYLWTAVTDWQYSLYIRSVVSEMASSQRLMVSFMHRQMAEKIWNYVRPSCLCRCRSDSLELFVDCSLSVTVSKNTEQFPFCNLWRT